MFARIKLTVPFSITKPTVGPLLGGEPNPFYPLVLFMNDNVPKNQKPVTDGSKLDRYSLNKQTYIYHAEIDQNLFDLNVAGLIVQQGGEIEGYPLWAKVDPTSQIPGEGEQPTWTEFFAATPTRTPTKVRTELGEDWYVSTAVFGEAYMPASHAMGIFGFENLVTQPQLDTLVANQEPEPEPEEPDSE